MKQPTILIVGASGQLGSALLKTLRSFSRVVGTYCTGKSNGLLHLDLQRPDQVHQVLRLVSPHIIINAAAMTHVDACEEHPDRAEQINVHGHRHLTEAARAVGAQIVFLSTYYVFDGKKGYYHEEDEPHPLNVYAWTKLRGEQITAAVQNFLLLRTSKIYSLGYDNRNFLVRLVNQFQQNQTIPVANDQYTNPISTEDAAAAIAALLARQATGTYHLGGPDYCTNYDFAALVAEAYGYDKRLLKPLATEQLGAAALRPKKCALLTQKLIKETAFEPQSLVKNLTSWNHQSLLAKK